MNIGILSGKGGTGKTTVSTNLAVLLKANYIDCDVEEPNGFIFLDPKIDLIKEVQVDYPFIDETKCTLCGECVNVCQFNALAKVKEDIVLFQKLCHSCGACQIACKHDAIEYRQRAVGNIEKGIHNSNRAVRGILNVGEPMAVPIIKELLNELEDGINILDFSPGTSCNVVTSLDHVDIAILVTEPTKFGLHDLKMAIKLMEIFNVPHGVVINKYIEEDLELQDYLKEKDIPILGIIPYSREAANYYSKGQMLLEINRYREVFKAIECRIREVFRWS